MQIDWLAAEVEATCPICGAAGRKAAILRTDHVIPDWPRITLLRCPECGAGFLANLTAPDYESEMPEMLDYYVEQGAGIDLIVAPLQRVRAGAVGRCLEIGCSFGYALDFSRHAFGWEVLGVDPSPLAVRGAAALGIPVRHAYFDAGLDLGPEPFDLVLCSEILEHVGDPHSLLVSIRERLSADGLLVLSTPNVEIVREGSEEGMVARALSAGLHLILYDRSSLALALAKAGFTDVVIEESPETLRAFAAVGRAAIERLLPADPIAARELLRKYLDDKANEVEPSSVLASGLAYRHFKECVNAGLYDEAIESRNRLARIYREGSGRRLPFNLVGALFFSGILELNALDRPDRAARYFEAAIDAADKLWQSASPVTLYDGETEALLRQSHKHLPMALAMTEPERALRELEKLEAMDRRRFPAQLLQETVDQTFVRLVNGGAYAAAEQLAPRIDVGSLDPLFCLAMLALQQGRAEEAAELFWRVGQAAEREGGEAHSALLQSARYHEALSRKKASAG